MKLVIVMAYDYWNYILLTLWNTIEKKFNINNLINIISEFFVNKQIKNNIYVLYIKININQDTFLFILNNLLI